MNDDTRNKKALSAYYRWHAKFYDITRWAFLFGRRELILDALGRLPAPGRILEIGCGTGKNLLALAEAFPEAEIIGLDLSRDMLDQAAPKLARFGSRVALRCQAYEGPISGDDPKFDLIVFSYSLSMINPGFDAVLAACREDLSPRGSVAVVDFHQTRWDWFRRWMGVNHVRLEGQILSQLDHLFSPVLCRVNHAYGDLWSYLIFIGRI